LLSAGKQYSVTHGVAASTTFNIRETPMLSWALTFFVIALIAAVFGFGGIAGAATGIAKLLFFAFLVLFVLSLIIPRFRNRAM